MRRKLVNGAYTIVGLAIAAQLIHLDPRNPPTDPAACMWNDRRIHPQVAAVLQRACADCHSHETRWPWYSQISPVNWLVARDVRKGRAKLNFSKWTGASRNVSQDIADAIDKGSMPPKEYVWMHPESKLSQADKDLLFAWADGKLNTAH